MATIIYFHDIETDTLFPAGMEITLLPTKGDILFIDTHLTSPDSKNPKFDVGESAVGGYYKVNNVSQIFSLPNQFIIIHLAQEVGEETHIAAYLVLEG